MKQAAFLVVFLFFIVSMPLISAAGDVSINIGVALPPLEFAAPPDVVVVPSGESYVYMVPDTPGVYFYGGYWYRTYGDRWYRSNIYSGPWSYIRSSHIPRVIIDVPPDYYRRLPRGYQRIHYGDLHRDWRRWDSGRHWNRYDWYKNERREHERWRRTEGRRPPGERYRPGDDRHGREGDMREQRGDRNRPEGERYKPGNDRRKPEGDVRGPQGDKNKPGSERYNPGNERRKPQGDDRKRPVVPNQEQGQDSQRQEQR